MHSLSNLLLFSNSTVESTVIFWPGTHCLATQSKPLLSLHPVLQVKISLLFCSFITLDTICIYICIFMKVIILTSVLLISWFFSVKPIDANPWLLCIIFAKCCSWVVECYTVLSPLCVRVAIYSGECILISSTSLIRQLEKFTFPLVGLYKVTTHAYS